LNRELNERGVKLIMSEASYSRALDMVYVEYMIAEILSRIEEEGISLRAAMEDYFKVKRIRDSNLKRLMRAFALGVLRNFRKADLLGELVVGKHKYWELSSYTRNLLRATLYELKYRNISVDRVLTILSKVDRVKVNRANLLHVKTVSLEDLIKEIPRTERLSVKYSQPVWIVEYLIKLLGYEEAIKLLKRFNRPSTMWLRVNTLLIKRSELIKKLRRRGVLVEEDRDLDDLIKVVKYKRPLASLPEYQKGYFYIQDKASALVSHVLNPSVKEKILDLCAAPGSKTTHLAQLSQDKAIVVASDWSFKRSLILKSSCERLRIESVLGVVSDSRILPLRSNLQFDKVLVDPDCSSLGRLGHSPEVRLWVKPRIVEELSKLQYQLLNVAIGIARRRGIIVYSTCTLTLEENELLIKRVIDEREDVELLETEPKIGINGFLKMKKAQRLFPHTHDTLGFFIAKLVKVK